jgi:hypothetical protein
VRQWGHDENKCGKRIGSRALEYASGNPLQSSRQQRQLRDLVRDFSSGNSGSRPRQEQTGSHFRWVYPHRSVFLLDAYDFSLERDFRDLYNAFVKKLHEGKQRRKTCIFSSPTLVSNTAQARFSQPCSGRWQ